MASPWEQAKAGQKISAPKQSKYQGNRGQSGGISSIPTQSRVQSYMQQDPYGAANIRQKYFDNRPIPTERLQRRGMQDKIVDQFKQQLINTDRVMKDSKGNVVLNANTGEPVFLTDIPGGKSVADVGRDAALQFGPTPSEILGDALYAFGSASKGLGIPFVSSIMRGVDVIKGTVESAWDAVRGEPTSAQGTAFPQPGSDTKDLFSSIDTGIAQVDPNNMLANIARQNQYEDIPFDQLLSNATAQNLNIPKTIQEVVTDVGLSPVVTVDTPLGKVNVNRLTGDLVTGGNVGNLNYVLQGNPLSEGYGANLNYGLGQGLGIEAAMGSGMTSPDVGLGYGGALPYGNYGIGLGTNLGTGDSSLKGQLGFRPVEYLFGPTAFNPTVSLGAQVSPSQNFEPQLSLNFGYKDGGSVNKNSGLGYMFK
jgi:hypothetical protein